MSLVTAAMSYWSRSRRHSCSMSAVLPEPTGPPTPMRGTDISPPNPPLRHQDTKRIPPLRLRAFVATPSWVSRNEQPGASVLVAHDRDVEQGRERAEVVEPHRVGRRH